MAHSGARPCSAPTGKGAARGDLREPGENGNAARTPGNARPRAGHTERPAGPARPCPGRTASTARAPGTARAPSTGSVLPGHRGSEQRRPGPAQRPAPRTQALTLTATAAPRPGPPREPPARKSFRGSRRAQRGEAEPEPEQPEEPEPGSARRAPVVPGEPRQCPESPGRAPGMAQAALGAAGLHFDELNKLRVLEPEVAAQTAQLREECRAFVDSECRGPGRAGRSSALLSPLSLINESPKLTAGLFALSSKPTAASKSCTKQER